MEAPPAARPPTAPPIRRRRGWFARLLWPEDQSTAAAGFTDYDRAITAILHRVDRDNALLNWRVFAVAALGFLTDSYNLFASNVVLPALSYIYWDWPSHKFESGFNVATLTGSIIGQILFGVMVDVYGRRSLYGIELLIVIIATVGLLQSSQGLVEPLTGGHTWNITPWLYFWRIIMGVGIGAEYPLSACIAAEWASTKTRSRMMAAVFFMQPLGQLLAYAVGLGALDHLDGSRISIDKFWRIVIGAGAVPTLLALVFRRNIPESWRFTYFVRKSPAKASMDLEDVYGGTNHHARGASVEMQNLNGRPPAPDAEPLIGQPGDTGPRHGEHDTQPPPLPVVREPPQNSVPAAPGSQFKWSEIWAYLRKDGNMSKLFATSFCWFVLDVAFYGMGFNSPGQIAKLFASQHVQFEPNAPWWQTNSAVVNITSTGVVDGTYSNGTIATDSIKKVLRSNMTHGVYITSIAAMTGSLLFVGTVHLLNRKAMLVGTFFALAGLLALTSGLFKVLFEDGANYTSPQPGGHIGLFILWGLLQFMFAFGPNTLTFIMPAEMFATRYRCTFYGIAAAFGKLGAVVVQSVIWHVPQGPNNWISLQYLLAAFSVCMALGGIVAFWLIPDVQDGVETKSLEELSDDKEFVQRPKVNGHV